MSLHFIKYIIGSSALLCLSRSSLIAKKAFSRSPEYIHFHTYITCCSNWYNKSSISHKHVACHFEKSIRYYKKENFKENVYEIKRLEFTIMSITKISQYNFEIIFYLPLTSAVFFEYNITHIGEANTYFESTTLYNATKADFQLLNTISITMSYDENKAFYISLLGISLNENQISLYQTCAGDDLTLENYMHDISDGIHELFINGTFNIYLGHIPLKYTISFNMPFGFKIFTKEPGNENFTPVVINAAQYRKPVMFVYYYNISMTCDIDEGTGMIFPRHSIEKAKVYDHFFTRLFYKNDRFCDSVAHNASKCDLLLFVGWFSRLDKVCYSKKNSTLFIISNVLSQLEYIAYILNDIYFFKRPACVHDPMIYKYRMYCFHVDAIIQVSFQDDEIEVFQMFIPIPIHNPMLTIHNSSKVMGDCEESLPVLYISSEIQVGSCENISSASILCLSHSNQSNSIVLRAFLEDFQCMSTSKFFLLVDLLDTKLETQSLDVIFFHGGGLYCIIEKKFYKITTEFFENVNFYNGFVHVRNAGRAKFFKEPFTYRGYFDGDEIFDEIAITNPIHGTFVLNPDYSSLHIRKRFTSKYFLCRDVNTIHAALDVDGDGYDDFLCTHFDKIYLAYNHF